VQTFITVINKDNADIIRNLENIRDMISDNGYIYINNAHYSQWLMFSD